MHFNHYICLLAALLACLPGAAAPKVDMHPLVAGSTGVIFGASVQGKWVDYDAMPSMITGGERYRLYSATAFLGTTTGSTVQEDGGTGPFITFDQLAQKTQGEAVIAVGGDWNVLPRVPKVQSPDQKVYQDLVDDLLTRKGLPEATVQITRLWRIDLEGDGSEEVLINATTPRAGFNKEAPYKRGDYSMVLLRKVVRGKAITIPIALSYYLHDAPAEGGGDRMPIIYTLTGVFDLNGDGILEVVLHTDALPDFLDSIYQINGSTVKAVLAAEQWV